MLVKFCGGYIDPSKVEGVMPGSRPGSYALAMAGGSFIMFECYSTGTLEMELERIGLFHKEEEQ